MSDVRVAVILLTLNQCTKTLRCLGSLRQVKYPELSIVLWDNGSKDDTSGIVRESFPEVLIHYSQANIGVASGRNKAVKLALEQFDFSYLLFIDNDMSVDPDFLEELITPFARDPYLAQTTGKILCLNNTQRIYGAGGCHVRFWRGNTMHVGYGEIDRGQYNNRRKCYPSGGCMLVRADIFQELSGFDSAFDPYGPEDLDFGIRARKAGYYGLYVPDAIVYHESNPGHTFEDGQYTQTYARYRSKTWLTLMNRHAPFWEKLVFMTLTAPFLFLKVTIREIRKRNFSAIKGLLGGVLEFGKSLLKSQQRNDADKY